MTAMHDWISKVLDWTDRRDAFCAVLESELLRRGIVLRGLTIGRDMTGGMWLVTVQLPGMTYATFRADIPQGTASTDHALAPDIADRISRWTQDNVRV